MSLNTSDLKSLQIQPNVSLKDLNTFGFDSRAEYFATTTSDQRLVDLLEFAEALGWPLFVLGGGSNLVLTRNISGLVMRIGDSKITYSLQPDGLVHVTAGAGVNWHALVMDTLSQGHGGLENLSLIPGTVGAAPVQNIGAYGVELVDRFVSLRAWHRPSRQFVGLDASECEFSYRNSRFKSERGDWIVLSVTLCVGRNVPLTTSYSSLADQLNTSGVMAPTAKDVSDAVIAVRQSRLPNPTVIGNAGSFFHNPIISAAEFARLSSEYPGMISYAMPDGQVKIAAGWLIDRLGYKGVRRGAVGVHDEQALVLVNHGGGNGQELLLLVEEIQSAVRAKYEIEMTIEPLVV